MFEWVKEIW